MNLFKISIVVLLGLVTGLVALLAFVVNDTQTQLLGVEEQQLKVNKEQHIEYLYSTYRSNINSCKELAKEEGKDEAFIKENCITPVNNSIIGQWLKEWGRDDLLITE